MAAYVFPHTVPTPTRLSARDYVDVPALTFGVSAVLLAAIGFVAGSVAVLLFAAGSLALGVGLSLTTATRTLMAPAQEQAG